jgi:hypothetical protein
VIKKRTYRYITALAFAVVFYIQTFCSLFFVADYYINTKAFAATCINKNKPKMHCDGKCQLEKKINTEDSSDKQNPERKNDTVNEVLSSKSFFASVEMPFKPVFIKEYCSINPGIPTDRSSRFFHPPKPTRVSVKTNEA